MIGAVLFIAVVMTAAAILTGWVFSIDLGAGGSAPQRQVQCQYAALGIFDATYHAGQGAVTVQVANQGTVRLANVTVTAFRRGVFQAQSTIRDLNRGRLKQTTFAVDRAPTLVHAGSVDCPAVNAQTASVDVAG